MNKLIAQILRFGMVGFFCFGVDYAIMVGLTELVNINYLLSSGISFSISVIVNYILSITIVFHSKKDTNKIKEFFVFVILSLFGLLLNQLIMWLSVDVMGVFYMLAKIFATGIVMVYNFITRKIFIEERTME